MYECVSHSPILYHPPGMMYEVGSYNEIRPLSLVNFREVDPINHELMSSDAEASQITIIAHSFIE